MRKGIFKGLACAGALTLSGCDSGSAGLGGEIQSCKPEFQSATPVTDEQLGTLVRFGEGLTNADGPEDPLHRQGDMGSFYDKVDKAGEIACRLEDGSLVLTTGGLALQEAMQENK